MDDAADSSRLEHAGDSARHTLTVAQVAQQLLDAGVPRSERRIKYYCQKNTLDAGYGLTTAGARELVAHGFPINAQIDWQLKNSRASGLFTQHTLEATQAMLLIDASCRARQDLQLHDHHDLIATFPSSNRVDPTHLRVTIEHALRRCEFRMRCSRSYQPPRGGTRVNRPVRAEPDFNCPLLSSQVIHSADMGVRNSRSRVSVFNSVRV
jgi:hypothetical protein